MKKVVRLTESDINRIVKRIIKEQNTSHSGDKVSKSFGGRNNPDLIKQFDEARKKLHNSGVDYEHKGNRFSGPFPPAKVIAFGLWISKGGNLFSNDKEAYAQDAMAMIRDKKIYDEVSKWIQYDPMEWVKSFMDGLQIKTDWHRNGKIPNIYNSYTAIMGGY